MARTAFRQSSSYIW